jgi:uncharacterized membrane protein YeaQ/YmgE (transglycosylase-associated protein family)
MVAVGVETWCSLAIRERRQAIGRRHASYREDKMTLEGIIIALIVGGMGGWLAGVIVKGAGFGIIGNIVIGIVGAFLASWLLPQLGLGFSVGNALVTSILYAMIGAIIVIVLLSIVRRAR